MIEERAPMIVVGVRYVLPDRRVIYRRRTVRDIEGHWLRLLNEIHE